MTGMFMLDDGIEGWLREYLARDILPDVPRRAATRAEAGRALPERPTDPRRYMRWDRRFG